jgi:NADH-quinone oxidoreductase subunit A
LTLEGYAPFVVFVAILCCVGLGMLGASMLLGPRPKSGRTKLEPWECGVDPVQPYARDRFAVPFYLVAILFILFDLETVFLFPWATVAKSLSAQDHAVALQLFFEVAAFVGVLAVGLFYVWKRRGLEWD